ncbi:non-specific lipid transfer protein GPI-anchored 16-like [Rutidosis leptorrhynchoides]|uniref:non-specific lipid transfer protein GPI-anchored 16-like n=1 Tax=Rutidosis leptorrhynchoides TaxID=125765 RepID=UPI003A99F8BE
MERFTILLAAILFVSIIAVTGQISTPCTLSMISSFTPCLNYVMGSSSNGGSPTKGCCDVVESLVNTSSECMCLIVTGNVPISLPSPINQALAITLPKACNSKSVPLQCKSTGVPLPPAGPALFVPPPPPKRPPPRAFPPTADSPYLPPSPSGSATSESIPAPAPYEMTPDDEPETPTALAPIAKQGSTSGSGIRPVLTPSSASNTLQISPLFLLITIVFNTIQMHKPIWMIDTIQMHKPIWMIDALPNKSKVYHTG